MTSIIPIPAFADNYMWLVREGDARRGGRPGRCRAGARLPRPRGPHARGDPRHAPSQRSRGRHRRRSLDRHPVPVFGPARERFRGARARSPRATASRCRACRMSLRVLDIPGHTAGHIAYVGDRAAVRRALLRRHAVRCRAADALFEGTPAQMWTSLSALAALPERHARLLRPRVHACEPALRAAVEPANAAAAQCAHGARGASASAASPPCPRRSRWSAPPIRSCARGRHDVQGAAATPRGPPACTSDVESFAALRAWKNAF